MKKLLATFAIILTILPITCLADTFYRETYNYCELNGGRPSAGVVSRWKALTTDHREGKPSILKIQTVGAGTGRQAVNSDPEGPIDGNAYWARQSRGLLLYTDEISFDIGSLTNVIWSQRIDRQDKMFANYGARMAFLIGDTWYISDYSAMQITRGTFERRNRNPYNTTYGTTPQTPGVGIAAPKNSGIGLPTSGNVTAFGLFLGRSYAGVRIDDFTLVNNAPTGTNALDTSYERCSLIITDPNVPVVLNDPEVDPGVDPDPSLPNPDVTTTTIVTEPPAPNTPPTPSDVSTSRFCGADNTASGITMSLKAQKKLLKSAKGSSLRSTRDRLVLSLASIGLQLNAISDIGVGDIIKIKRKYYINLSTGQQIRISNSLAKSLTRYLRKAGIRNTGEAAFRRLAPNGRSLTSEPLCVSEMIAIIKTYSQKGKISGLVSFY